MLIGYIMFRQIFGYHPNDNQKGQKITKMTDRVMGPDFGLLRDTGIDCGEQLLKRESEDLAIRSGDGLCLKALRFAADSASDRTVILVHGHNSSGMKDAPIKALGYLRAGYNVLIPDNRACGRSEGKWQTFGAKESEDILLWIKKLLEKDPAQRVVVDGCSMGGATVCLLSDKDLPENVRVLVSDCAFADTEEEFRYMIKKFIHLPAGPLLRSVEFWDKRINHLRYADQRPLSAVSHTKVPMIFVHGAEDRFIPVGNARRLYEACSSDKLLILIDGAGHAAACVKGGDGYFKPVLNFIDCHI